MKTIIDDNLYKINGGLSVLNKVGDNMLDCNILFGGSAGIGTYGISKVYTSSSNKLVYDIISASNLKYKSSNWDSRGVLPTCSPSAIPVNTPVAQTAVDIESLEKQLDDIINGVSPIYNLVVNGSLVVDSKLDSPLTLDVQSCDPTSLVGFNNLDARGVNGYGGPFDWFGSYFDSTKTISYSGINQTGLQSVN